MSGEKILNKKRLFLWVLGIIVLLGVIGGGYYWWTGTPEYGISQIKKAIETHNSELGLKYIDTDAIFENFWTDTKSKLMSETSGTEGFEAFGMMLGVQLIESMKPTLKEQVKQGVESWFSASTAEKPQEATSTKKKLELGAVWQQKNLKIKKQGSSAYIELPDNVKIVFTKKEGKRYWVISKIEGFAGNFPTTENTKQATSSSPQEKIATSSEQDNIQTNKVTLEITNKGFYAGDYQNQITMNLKFTNTTDKEIRGVEGVLTFYDIFDNKISATKVSYDKGIPANGSKVWESGTDYNQFMDEDVKLKNTELKDLKYKWDVSTIIYTDGNKETF